MPRFVRVHSDLLSVGLGLFFSAVEKGLEQILFEKSIFAKVCSDLRPFSA